ncbi:unnamed protein product [Alternaria alternata]
MLFLSKVLLFAPYLLPILASAHHSQRQGPFALTLNPTSIIASPVNSSGRVELRTYQATSEYLSYFDDTISQFDPQNRFNEPWECSKAAISTFRTAIAGITKDLTESLGYEDRIRSFLDSSIREVVASCKWYEMDDLRAVVVVGEVPRAAIAKLENLVQETLKLDHITMLNDIDAALVKSYGAASYALHTEVHPEAYQDQVFVSPPLEHREL